MKLMRRRKFVNHKKRIMYFSLFFMLLFISVGYAYLNATLSINGHTELSANTWNIHFENLSVTDGSVAASIPAAIQSNNTNINYSVILEMPGDFYEFEVDIVNSGSLPGKLSLTQIEGISSVAELYLDSSIKYTNGNDVQVDDLINPGARKRIVVRVSYKENLNSLPEEDIELDLVFNTVYTQTNEEEILVDGLIQNLATDNACITKYEGQVTDRVGITETATNVYFDECPDKRNVIFGGFCWQVIRTTQTGGVKMVYNGEPDNDGHCGTSRGDHKGIVQGGYGSEMLSSSYLYGSSFTYDTSTNEFTLIDTTTATWSNSTYQNLIGKYTCKNMSGTCTTIYNVNDYDSSSSAFAVYYTISSTNYAQIGTTAFNANEKSASMVGYMFNKSYNYKYKMPKTTEYKYGNSFTYSNGTYTLSGTTQNINNWSAGYSSINNMHYTCWNTSGECSTISYLIFVNQSQAFYINLTDGKSVNDALNEMLFDNNVNRYNSSMKGLIDSWYAQNLLSYTNKLEDTVYCGARNIIDYAGWNPNGGDLNYVTSYLSFKNFVNTSDLSCSNDTDQFAVSNSKAKLTYPVALVGSEEWSHLTNASLRTTGARYWWLSPSCFSYLDPYVRYVYVDGDMYKDVIVNNHGSRPVITLKSSASITSGTGSETDPWIVE